MEVRKPNHWNPNFETFRFRMDSEFECSEFEPRLYSEFECSVFHIPTVDCIQCTVESRFPDGQKYPKMKTAMWCKINIINGFYFCRKPNVDIRSSVNISVIIRQIVRNSVTCVKTSESSFFTLIQPQNPTEHS